MVTSEARIGELGDARISELDLDPKNYRFPVDQAGSTQSDLLRLLDRDFELLPVGKSLADNGYFRQEPLVVIPPENVGSNHRIVVEGNRRLAALKFLTDPNLRRLSLEPDEWARLGAASTHNLTAVPVVQYPDRQSVLAFLGHRHITGIKKWDPLSKARFVSSLIQSSGGRIPYDVLAREIGSKASTVRDNHVAYQLMMQAENLGIDISRVVRSFSVFYRALAYSQIQGYLGLRKDDFGPEKVDPIPRENRAKLEDLIRFVHGTGREEPILTDSRQLSKLAEVLPVPEAVQQLKISRNLDLAWRTSGGEVAFLSDNLGNGWYYVREALRDAYRHKDEAAIKRKVEELAGAVGELVKNFPEAKRLICGA